MQRAFITNVEKFWRAVIFPVLNMHALILQFISHCVCIYSFSLQHDSLLIRPFWVQLVISNWMYLNHYGCFCLFCFHLTKVIHMLAYSFFAPTIYVWIICHRRICADEILNLWYLVLFFFLFLSKGKKSWVHFTADCKFLWDYCSLVCVCTIWRMIWSLCSIYVYSPVFD